MDDDRGQVARVHDPSAGDAAGRSVCPYYVAQSEVTCPWEAKGKVMRLLNQQYKERLAEQIDGVKIMLG